MQELFCTIDTTREIRPRAAMALGCGLLPSNKTHQLDGGSLLRGLSAQGDEQIIWSPESLAGGGANIFPRERPPPWLPTLFKELGLIQRHYRRYNSTTVEGANGSAMKGYYLAGNVSEPVPVPVVKSHDAS